MPKPRLQGKPDLHDQSKRTPLRALKLGLLLVLDRQLSHRISNHHNSQSRLSWGCHVNLQNLLFICTNHISRDSSTFHDRLRSKPLLTLRFDALLVLCGQLRHRTSHLDNTQAAFDGDTLALRRTLISIVYALYSPEHPTPLSPEHPHI